MTPGYDWQNTDGPANAEKIAGGTHDLRIGRVVYGAKDKPAFTSRAGDPQIMLIWEDREAREAVQMLTLSKKAGWVLAKILKHATRDGAALPLDRMTADGVEPSTFADPNFADANLIGLQMRALVTWSAGKDGKDYADIEPLRPDPTAGTVPSTPTAPAAANGSLEDIPI